MATLHVPALLRGFCGGARSLTVEAETLGELLKAVDLRCPGIYDRVVEDGRIRPELMIALGGEVVSLPLHERLEPGAELTIVPAIAGG